MTCPDPQFCARLLTVLKKSRVAATAEPALPQNAKVSNVDQLSLCSLCDHDP